ncbi:MAG TPA: SMP-30/gluconolactonase/LRE family protein [Bauldia sp.]|nr:SMP-30/gluconolactonase/LRE family protein [Bauldia sp.]
MFAAPPVLETTVFTKLPPELSKLGQRSAWAEARGGKYHSFLEGPSFDRAGNLYCVDIPYGRIFRISPEGRWTVFAEYDGEPNGLKIHRDGSIYVADQKNGLLRFDAKTGERTVVVDRPHGERFKGLNDLVFANNGDIYFTDQGRSDLKSPHGRVYRLTARGSLEVVFDGLAAPNGLALNKQQTMLYVAVTCANQILGVVIEHGDAIGKAYVTVQMLGGPRGPDGMAVDEEGNIVAVAAGFGTVWMFSRFGEPLYRIKSCTGLRTTNVAYGGPDRSTLYITEGEAGAILQVRLPTPGVTLYSHM